MSLNEHLKKETATSLKKYMYLQIEIEKKLLFVMYDLCVNYRKPYTIMQFHPS